MNTLERNQDIVSGADDLEHLYTFKNFPVFMGCVDQSQNEDIINDMSWHISKSSGMIQLNPLLPLDIVYQTEHNPGTTGKAWLDHHRAFADFIAKHDPKNVFEIGGSHGILSQYYQETHPDTAWTILEPNPIPVPGLKAKMLPGFFTENTKIDPSVDMIVHSHVLEHIYDPDDFFKALLNVEFDTKMCFSIPNLKLYLEKRYTNTLNFEHTFYCSEDYVKLWLERNGFELIEEYYYSDFSIFYSCVRTTMHVVRDPSSELYSNNKKLFQEYLDYYTELIKDLNNAIKDSKGPVYLFGAHIFSQFLLSFGLDRSKIECILDNSTLKHDKRLYGTDLMVHSPSILKGIESPTIIVRCGVFTDEISQDILQNINSTARII